MVRDLPIKIIPIDSLKEEWNMSFNDIFLMVLNYDLTPVYRKNLDRDWKKYGDDEGDDVVELFIGTRKDKLPLLFLREDIRRLEQDFGGGISKSADVISEDDILKRWGISRTELWNLVEECSLDVVDPVGCKFNDDFNHMDAFLAAYKNYEEVRWYLKLSDIERIEKEYDIKPKKGQRKLRPCQIHKERCREVAKKLWQDDPTKTIKDLTIHDEIRKVCDKKVYIPKTIRGWIKDLCPNRSPGKRPKKVGTNPPISH